jgi:hypothetical protein
VPPFAAIWDRIVALQGEQFATITLLPFTYRVDGEALYPSRTHYRLSRGNFEKAYAMVPFSGPGTVNNSIRGPAYVSSILHDARVSQGAWHSPT